VKSDEIEQVWVGTDEKHLLEEFWNFLHSLATLPILTGWNIRDFDLAFIRHRSAINGVHSDWLRELRASWHRDMMLEVGGNGRSWLKKDEVCEAYGIKSEQPNTTGRDVPKLFAEGKLDEIRAHCLDDIRREWKLWKRLREAGLI